MPGLDPGIHQSLKDSCEGRWITGSGPVMTHPLDAARLLRFRKQQTDLPAVDGQIAHRSHALVARRANVSQSAGVDLTPKSPASFRASRPARATVLLGRPGTGRPQGWR